MSETWAVYYTVKFGVPERCLVSGVTEDQADQILYEMYGSVFVYEARIELDNWQDRG